MAIEVLDGGILSTLQDAGRPGLGHLGINPGGWQDAVSAKLANILVGNDDNCAVLEMFFPSAQLRFNTPAIIAITGADFEAKADGLVIPTHRPVYLPAGSMLRFTRWTAGRVAYLAVAGGFAVPEVLGSKSVHLAGGFGGLFGRKLQTADFLPVIHATNVLLKAIEPVSWFTRSIAPLTDTPMPIEVIPGPEWHFMTPSQQQQLLHMEFTIGGGANRMAYPLQNSTGILPPANHTGILSSGVCFGTVQWLPSGQFIVLMADHQTTGGYPRVLQVIRAHLPLLAQAGPATRITL
ncbi:MAG TPA: biotin-dependent carboxyltransferase family protein, partial [Phnomibacter sp.]|nr:biotin-dependent carboxyltransferase family protein [Phnomibacter sp.]